LGARHVHCQRERALDLALDVVDDIVLCTHGDVVEEVLTGLHRLGWPLPDERPLAKGSTWVLSAKGDCQYLPPAA
jgi:hypothetical protein